MTESYYAIQSFILFMVHPYFGILVDIIVILIMFSFNLYVYLNFIICCIRNNTNFIQLFIIYILKYLCRQERVIYTNFLKRFSFSFEFGDK